MDYKYSTSIYFGYLTVSCLNKEQGSSLMCELDRYSHIVADIVANYSVLSIIVSIVLFCDEILMWDIVGHSSHA